MKNFFLIVPLLAAVLTHPAVAAQTDRSYYVTEMTVQNKFDIYNDGRNTFLELVPGLVVTGATADGEHYIVRGVPSQIHGFINGKAITIVRGSPPAPPKPKPIVSAPDSEELTKEIERLTEELNGLVNTPEIKETLDAREMEIVAEVKPVKTSSVLPAPTASTNMSVAAPAAHQYIGIDDRAVVWEATTEDGNLRLLIERWAKKVNWTPVWEVERDIPIGSNDKMANDFKSAVRRVLASTEFGDIQVKPCFHSNNVIRVVRKTTKCNPTE